jgi:hypothetical protein
MGRELLLPHTVGEPTFLLPHTVGSQLFSSPTPWGRPGGGVLTEAPLPNPPHPMGRELNNCSELLTSFLWVGLQPDIGA